MNSETFNRNAISISKSVTTGTVTSKSVATGTVTAGAVTTGTVTTGAVNYATISISKSATTGAVAAAAAGAVTTGTMTQKGNYRHRNCQSQALISPKKGAFFLP